MKKLILIVATGTLLVACEKKEPTPTPTPEPQPIKALSVLNDNTTYTTVFDSAHSLGGVNNVNSINISDFTLESNNRLNFNYYTEVGTQQSPLRTNFRFTKDLSSNQFISQPSNIGQYPLNLNISYDKVTYQYFPYTNIFTFSALKYSTGFGSNNGATFGGDISASATSPNPIGTPDFSFRHPVLNSGAAFGYFSSTTPIATSIGSGFACFNGAVGTQNNYYKGGCLHDVYTGNNVNEFFAFGIKLDSVKVFKLNYTSFGTFTTYPVYTTTQINSMPTTLGISGGNGSIIRHYSSDGKTLSFMLTEYDGKVSTYIYNFATNTLSQNLKQVTLDYSGTGSDIDLDENGNVYYTGYASNGSNTNGVSVYKKSSSAAATLVGTDNFLKSGTVVKLRILAGKVFMAVTAKQTGKDIYQISIIKQN